MILEQCKGVHCVDLGESFQTHIFLQNFVSIQPRTSPVKFAASRDVTVTVRPGLQRDLASLPVGGPPVADSAKDAEKEPARSRRGAFDSQLSGPLLQFYVLADLAVPLAPSGPRMPLELAFLFKN